MNGTAAISAIRSPSRGFTLINRVEHAMLAQSLHTDTVELAAYQQTQRRA